MCLVDMMQHIIGEKNILSCSLWANEGKAVVDAITSFQECSEHEIRPIFACYDYVNEHTIKV